MTYDPKKWCWLGQPDGAAEPVVYSSAARALLAPTDAQYMAWLAADARRAATPWPRDERGEATYAALDEVLIAAGLPPTGLAPVTAADLAPRVKAECARRIYAIASDSAQKNSLANVATGALAGADLDVWKAGVVWIGEMQAVSRALIAACDVTYADDAHWPPPPPGAADLAKRY